MRALRRLLRRFVRDPRYIHRGPDTLELRNRAAYEAWARKYGLRA